MKEIKCPNCGNWTPANQSSCSICGQPIRDLHAEELERRKAEETNSLPIIKIHENDPAWKKAVKKPIQLAQLIFFGVISLIAAMAASTVH